jgi:hypothetical protein
MLLGYSKGAYDATRWTEENPSRILGFFNEIGGDGVFLNQPQASFVPGLATDGNGDSFYSSIRYNTVGHGDNVGSWRSTDGEVGFATDWGTGHNTLPDITELGWAWVADVVKLRYPAGQVPSTTPNTPFNLNQISKTNGWKATANNAGQSSSISAFDSISQYNVRLSLGGQQRSGVAFVSVQHRAEHHVPLADAKRARLVQRHGEFARPRITSVAHRLVRW